MLIEFKIENFLSFSECKSLNMVAVPDRKGSKYNEDSEEGVNEDLNLLKGAAIFGPNESGKTNLIKAFHFFVLFTKNSRKYDIDIDIIQKNYFKFIDGYDKKPTCFEADFACGNNVYKYGFSINGNEIIKEYLFLFKGGNRKSVLFERELQSFKFNKKLTGSARVISKKIKKESLLLSELFVCPEYVKKETSIKEVYDWFNGFLIVDVVGGIDRMDKYFDKFIFNTDELEKNKFEKMKDVFLNCSQCIGLDIVDVSIVETFGKRSVFLHYNQYDENRNLKPEKNIVKIEPGSSIKRIFSLAILVSDAIENGKILVIDNLDIGLHPLLLKSIVNLFNNYKNKKAQIIFTCHDTYIIDNSKLRKEQIWLVDKNSCNESDLWSISDFKGFKKFKNVGKSYILGRFGAVPFGVSIKMEMAGGVK